MVAILADFLDFAALVFMQRGHGPVIDDQNIDATQSGQEVAQAAVGSDQSQLAKQGGKPAGRERNSHRDKLSVPEPKR